MSSRGAVLGLVLLVTLTMVWLCMPCQGGGFHYSLSKADPQLPALLKRDGYALHELEVEPGVQVRAAIRPPSLASERFLLLFPGNTDPQLATAIPMLEGMRAGRAMGMAVFAYRGFDGSTGRPSPSNAALDARAELAYLQQQLGVSHGQLVLVGYSMGSGIALRLAAELSARGEPPAALILLSPYWTLELTPAYAWGALLPTETYRVDDVISSVTQPVLVVAGARDEALPIAQHARQLVHALGSRAQYWELPRANHHDYLRDMTLLRRVGDFALSPVKR